jgi:hypothetical protein
MEPSENSAFTELALDVTDNRITSSTEASNLRGAVGALPAMEMQMLYIYLFPFPHFLALAHLNLKAWKKQLQDRRPSQEATSLLRGSPKRRAQR